MSLEEKIGFLSNLNKKLKDSITPKIITYSLAGMLTLGCSSILKQKERDSLKDKEDVSELCECWSKTYRQSGWANIGLDIAIDKNKNLYAIGYYNDEEDYNQFVVLKYNNYGRFLDEFKIWKEKGDIIDLNNNIRISVDNDENVYISTSIKNKDMDIELVKLDKTGKKIWKRVYDSGSDEKHGDISIDNDGNIIIGGSAYKDKWKHILIKYNKEGNKIWENLYDYGNGQIESITIDKSNNIITTGNGSISVKPKISLGKGWKVVEGNLEEFRVNEYHLVVAKYNNQGEKLWHATHRSTKGYDLAIDNKEDVYVLGGSEKSNIEEFALLKYNATGNLILEKNYFGLGYPNSIVIYDNYLYILMYYRNLIKYDKNGNKLFAINAPSNGHGNKLIIDEDNLYIIGKTTVSLGDAPDLLMTKICNSCGNISEIEGCHKKCDEEEDMCLDECSNRGNKLMAGKTMECKDENLFNCIVSCWPKCSEASETCKDDCGSAKELEIIDDRYSNLGSKIIIEEFADFECPYSKEVQTTLNQIKKEYTKGDLQIVYKHSPRKSHKFAFKAAEASECARDQGKFWEYHDKLFENQDSLGIDSLKQHASDLGLNTEQFNECLDLGIKKRIIKKDIEEGEKMKIMGVPTFFINDTTLIGIQDIEKFYNIIDIYLGGPKTRLIWNSTYDSGDDDLGNDFILDNDRNIYVVGYTDVATKRNGILLKYNGDGNLLWKKTYNNNYNNELIKVALDDFNNIYITGLAYKGNEDYISTIRYNENGELLWDKSYDSGKDEELRGIIVDKSKDVYIAGILKDGESSDCLLIKYDKDGKLKWSKTYDTEFKDDILNFVLDDNQNITLAVESYKEEDNSSNKKLRLVRFNKEGSILEDKIIEELPNNLNPLPVDNLGYGYEIVGAYGFEDKDFVITKMFNNREIWEKNFNSEYQDIPVAIRIDNSNNIYVLNYFYNNDENRDIRVIKLKQPEIKINCNEQCNLNYYNCMDDNSVWDNDSYCEEEKEDCNSKCPDESDE